MSLIALTVAGPVLCALALGQHTAAIVTSRTTPARLAVTGP